MRLIDADQMAVDETEAYMAAQEHIDDLSLLRANLLTHAKLQKLLADAPTVDAVPVVRCRECVSYGADAFGYNCCNYPEGLAFPDDNSYCCYGMRRREDKNNG